MASGDSFPIPWVAFGAGCANTWGRALVIILQSTEMGRLENLLRFETISLRSLVGDGMSQMESIRRNNSQHSLLCILGAISRLTNRQQVSFFLKCNS